MDVVLLRYSRVDRGHDRVGRQLVGPKRILFIAGMDIRIKVLQYRQTSNLPAATQDCAELRDLTFHRGRFSWSSLYVLYRCTVVRGRTRKCSQIFVAGRHLARRNFWPAGIKICKLVMGELEV